MKKLFAITLFAVVTLGATGTTSPAFCKGERQMCYRSCVDCRTRCKGDEACRRTCYEIKRSCCSSNGYGAGPHKDCSCT